MVNVKKVLQGLKCCEKDCADGCDYCNDGCIHKLAKDAHDLITKYRRDVDSANRCVARETKTVWELKEKLKDATRSAEAYDGALELLSDRMQMNAGDGNAAASAEDAELIRILSEQEENDEGI